MVDLGSGSCAVGATLFALATASAHDSGSELAGHAALTGAVIALEACHGVFLSAGTRKARTSVLDVRAQRFRDYLITQGGHLCSFAGHCAF